MPAVLNVPTAAVSSRPSEPPQKSSRGEKDATGAKRWWEKRGPQEQVALQEMQGVWLFQIRGKYCLLSQDWQQGWFAK